MQRNTSTGFLATWTHTLSLAAALWISTAVGVSAAPVIDGRYDPGEGYTTGFNLTLKSDHNAPVADPAQLWWAFDGTAASVALVLPRSFVDNSYGVNAIGWGSGGHTFNNLKDSDEARLLFKDSAGLTQLDLSIDYLKEVTSGSYDAVSNNAGATVASSLDYNFNTLGHKLTVNSPAADINYVVSDSTYSNWLFDVVYEARIASASWFQNVVVSEIHASPNKTRDGNKGLVTAMNSIPTQPPPPGPQPIPEPSTALLFSLGAAAALWRRRRAA